MNYRSRNTIFSLFIAQIMVISLIFIGINISNANQGDLELNQTAGSDLPIMGYAAIIINGENVEGDVAGSTVGEIYVGVDHFLFYTYRHELTQYLDAASGMATGRTTSSPVIITKPMDKASPQIMLGLAQNQVVEGEFKFFDINPDDGSTRLRFSVEISGGKIGSIRTLSILDEGQTHLIEEVSFTFQTIIFTDVVSGASTMWTWDSDA